MLYPYVFCEIGSGPYFNAEFKMPRTNPKLSLMTFPRWVTERAMSTMYETIHVLGKLAFFDQSYVIWWQLYLILQLKSLIALKPIGTLDNEVDRHLEHA